jgi:hypothetical protein
MTQSSLEMICHRVRIIRIRKVNVKASSRKSEIAPTSPDQKMSPITY